MIFAVKKIKQDNKTESVRDPVGGHSGKFTLRSEQCEKDSLSRAQAEHSSEKKGYM